MRVPPPESKRVYGTAAFLGLGLAMSIVAGTGAWQRGRVLDTQRLVLRDSQGRVRAQMFTDEQGLTKIALLDTEGRDRVALKAGTDDNAALELYDSGRLQVSIVSDTQGRAAVRLFDPKNEGRASLYLTPENTAGLELMSKNRRVEVASQADGMGGIVVSDALGAVDRKLGVLPENLAIIHAGGVDRPFQPVNARPALKRPQPASPGDSSLSAFGSAQPIAATPASAD